MLSEVVPFAPPDVAAADVAALERALRSGWLTTGGECLRLEEELAAALDAPHVVSVSSATAAIEIAYAALDLPVGARVGVPTWTFVSSALAPHHHGAVPVLLDADADTLNVAPAAVEAAIGQVDALVVVHYGGVPVDRRVLEVAEAAAVPVIEDTAHALGARDHRGPMGGAGTVGSCLSFYATKNLTCGEGGALVTHRDDVAAFARSFRLHGLSNDSWDRYRPGRWTQYDLIGPGIKANLPDLLAALARSQLARFDALQARRRALVLRYRAALDGVAGLRFVPGELAERGADHLAVVVLPEGVDRSAVQAVMGEAGVASSVHFQPLHRFGWMAANAELGPAGVAVAESMADLVLSLPLSSAHTEAQVDRVVEVLLGALAR